MARLQLPQWGDPENLLPCKMIVNTMIFPNDTTSRTSAVPRESGLARCSQRPAIKSLALFFAVLLSACGTRQNDPAGRIPVAVSIMPLGDLTREVGGDLVAVSVLLPPAVNPHTFDFTPEHIRTASASRLLVLNGAGLEFWADKLRENLGAGGPHIIETCSGIPLLAADHGPSGNPHVWLDPILAIAAVAKIRDGLIAADSTHGDTYKSNAERYIDTLRALDKEIREETGRWRHRSFVSYHPTLAYFARRYGLNQIATIEKHPGREISAKELYEITTLIRREKVPAVVAETVSPRKAAETLALESGASLVLIDPMGDPSVSPTYTEMMRRIVRNLAAALR
jgi:zinc transport system substrate-binding protein